MSAVEILRNDAGKIVGADNHSETAAPRIDTAHDLVRSTGWGPKPMVAIDIFRVKDGKVVEHWDVMQEEVSAERQRAEMRFACGE